jgi:hypothetical protein
VQGGRGTSFAQADTMFRRFKLWIVWFICAGAITAMAVAYERDQPRFSFNPFCGARFAYRLDVTIEVEGKQYSSAASSELQYNRISTGGVCSQTVGSILPFRLSDNRLVVVNARLCPEALKAFGGGYVAKPWDQGSRADAAFTSSMKEHKKLDIASLCLGISRDRSGLNEARYDGYFLDSADNPQKWWGFSFDRNPHFDGISESERPRIVSAVAEATNRPPEDLLEKVAPATLKTEFEGEWSNSPAWMFYDRRKRQSSYGSYGESTFHASEERHQMPIAPGLPTGAR